MKKIIFGLMFCVIAISSVYAIDEALVAKATEIEKKEKELLNGNVQSAMMMGQTEQILRKYSKQCFNKKWEYCGPASAAIKVQLEMGPKGKAYADKVNKHKKLYYFVCDELPDDVYSGRLQGMLMDAAMYYNLMDKNYEKRDQCIRKICSYIARTTQPDENFGIEECFQELKSSYK